MVCYVKLSRNRPDFEKLSRDRGQQPRTLYSSLPQRPGTLNWKRLVFLLSKILYKKCDLKACKFHVCSYVVLVRDFPSTFTGQIPGYNNILGSLEKSTAVW